MSGGRQGADGLAFWYVRDAEREGSVYGNHDKWEGLGVFIDTFDNNGRGAGPSVLAVLNDGTKEYDHAADGESLSLGRCTAAVRNQPKHSLIRITYDSKELRVDLDAGGGGWRSCFTAPMSLPVGYHFGVTAATGGLADTHDLFLLSTVDLHRGPPNAPPHPPPPTPAPSVLNEAANANNGAQQQQDQVPVPPAPQYVTAAPVAPPPLPQPPQYAPPIPNYPPPPPPQYQPPPPPPPVAQYQPPPPPPSLDATQVQMLASAVGSLQAQLGDVRRDLAELRAALGGVSAQTATETSRVAEGIAERHVSSAIDRLGQLLNNHVATLKCGANHSSS